MSRWKKQQDRIINFELIAKVVAGPARSPLFGLLSLPLRVVSLLSLASEAICLPFSGEPFLLHWALDWMF